MYWITNYVGNVLIPCNYSILKVNFHFTCASSLSPELKTEIPICWLIWRLNSWRKQAIFNLEIKKKSGSSINPDIHHSKVPSSCPFISFFNLLLIVRHTSSLLPHLLFLFSVPSSLLLSHFSFIPLPFSRILCTTFHIHSPLSFIPCLFLSRS